MYDIEMGFKSFTRKYINSNSDDTYNINNDIDTIYNNIIGIISSIFCLTVNLLLCGYIIYHSFVNILPPIITYILSIVYIVLSTKLVIKFLINHTILGLKTT